MTPAPGQKIGPYEVIELLGSGGMGHVLRAWDQRLHREVALKLLRSDFQMPNKMERFLREARAASALTHPNICTVYDLGEHQGNPYLVMELLEGETLRQRMSYGPIAVDDVIRYGEEIADALAAAHSKGIIHRDVKPANIFLVDRPGGRRQVKVLDFGLAKVMHESREHSSEDLTIYGSTVGTVAYMSPEQARGEALDTRSDLFSLGVVLYEMAAGQVPFRGATSAVVFVKLLREEAPGLRQHNAAVPERLEDLIDSLLAKQPEERLQSAHALAQRLQALRSSGSAPSEQSTARPASFETPSPSRATQTQSSQAWTPQPKSPASPLPPAAPVARPTEVITPAAPRVLSTPSPVPPSQQRPPAADAAMPQGEEAGGSRPALPVITDPISAQSRVASLKEPRSPFGVSKSHQRPRLSVVIEDEPDEPLPSQTSGGKATPDVRSRAPLWAGLVFLALVAVGLVLWFIRAGTDGRNGPTAFSANDSLLLTPFVNRTGNTELGINSDGDLQRELQSAQRFHVIGTSALSGGGLDGRTFAPQDLQREARRLNARAYFTGEIRGDGPPYTFSFSLIDSSTGATLSSGEQILSTTTQLGGTISQIVAIVRSDLGEKADTIGQPVPAAGTR